MSNKICDLRLKRNLTIKCEILEGLFFLVEQRIISYICFTLVKLYQFCIVAKIQKYRKIIFFRSYFQDFFDKQTSKVKAKIVWTFELVEDLQRVPENYLKHIENTDGLYEIRVQTGSDIFRIFCFFEQGQLIVLAQGFQKKTQKTPKKEIEMALKIKREYENSK